MSLFDQLRERAASTNRCSVFIKAPDLGQSILDPMLVCGKPAEAWVDDWPMCHDHAVEYAEHREHAHKHI